MLKRKPKMLHKLLDTLSGVEIISDEKWLPIYKGRAGVTYIGPVEESAPTATEEVTEDTTPKRKKSK
jgi:hypothetical protein